MACLAQVFFYRQLSNTLFNHYYKRNFFHPCIFHPLRLPKSVSTKGIFHLTCNHPFLKDVHTQRVDLTGCLIVIRILSLIFGISRSGTVFVVIYEIKVSIFIGCGSVVAGIVSSMFVVVVYSVSDVVSSL